MTLNIDGVLTAVLTRPSFISNEGQVVLGVHGIRKEPELSRPYFGHLYRRGKEKPARDRQWDIPWISHPGGDDYEKCLVSIDRNTNELVAVRQEHVFIPNIVKGVTLDP